MPPSSERSRRAVHAIATAAVAGIWAYHGIVPKILTEDPDERVPFERLGFSAESSRALVRATGVGEVAFAVLLLARNRKRWPWALTIASMPVLAVASVVADRRLAGRSFNPVTLN